MKHKHFKLLAQAQYLRTRAEPHIVSRELESLTHGQTDLYQYYLPWKLTDEQEDTIDDQIRSAKAQIEQESEAWDRKHGRQTEKVAVEEQPSLEPEPAPQAADPTPEAVSADDVASKAEIEADKDQHDVSGDVLVEADEDTVIY